MTTTKPLLTLSDYKKAAAKLGVEVAVIRAVAEVESAGAGFLESGEPKILFERHIFRRLTNGEWDAIPSISNAVPGGYGPTSYQHKRLQLAVVLDREAALQSASWGKFQVLGANWDELGYESLQEFVNAMYRSEADHLEAFCRFVIAKGLVGALKEKDWVAFARGYNGVNFRVNRYDERLARAYRKYREVKD